MYGLLVYRNAALHAKDIPEKYPQNCGSGRSLSTANHINHALVKCEQIMHPIIQYRIYCNDIFRPCRARHTCLSGNVFMHVITVKLMHAVWGSDQPGVKPKILRSIEDKKIGVQLPESNRDCYKRVWAHDTPDTHVRGRAVELRSPVIYELATNSLI